MKKLSKFKKLLLKGDHKSYLVLFFLFGVLVVLIAALIIYNRAKTPIYGFIEGISVESFGMLLDILVLGVIFHYFKGKGEKERRIERYKEEIDDFRGWSEPEAKFRIVGNIKRLLRLGAKNLDLNNCFLKGTNLDKANLSSVNLHKANLSESELIGVDMTDAFLLFTDLLYAKMTCAKLNKAELSRADLSNAKLVEADLSSANLFCTKLTNVNLAGAKLFKANLSGANLSGANLSGANGLTLEQLLQAKTLYKANGLPLEIEKELREKKPQLFIKP